MKKYFNTLINLFSLLIFISLFFNSCTPEETITKVAKVVVTDTDGNVYSTVKIGTQEWMVENLKTTKYNDGTSIPFANGGTAPSYCFYYNDVANKNSYGALYNWYTVNTGKLAPTGWHVPTDAEWTTLTTYLTNNGYVGSVSGGAKSMASTSGWNLSSTIGTVGNNQASNNSSGFAGPPGGYRNYDWTFANIGSAGYWWSSAEYSPPGTEYNPNAAWYRALSYRSINVARGISGKQFGLSVRCVRD